MTNVPDGPTAGAAEMVLVTPVHDDSWCHTVAYTSSILVGAGLARELGMEGVDGAAAETLFRDALDAGDDSAELGGAQRIVTAGAGLDYVTARELALKIAEGARVGAAAFHLETLLHGHLAGEDAGTALVLVDSDRDSVRIGRRAGIAAAAVGEIGMPVVSLGGPPATELAAPVARLLWGAAALQALTLGLVRARGVNPDLIRRDEEPYRRAGSAGDDDW